MTTQIQSSGPRKDKFPPLLALSPSLRCRLVAGSGLRSGVGTIAGPRIRQKRNMYDIHIIVNDYSGQGRMKILVLDRKVTCTIYISQSMTVPDKAE